MIALPGVAIQSKIYESSASLVYRGIRVQDNRSLIVKMLKQDYPSTQELTRYKQEYEITRSLNLQGVIKAYSQQEYQRTLVILLEDFGGESLEQWMHKCPETFSPMPLSTFLRLAIDLTDILGRIHAADVIHKDINPGNIVLNPHTGVVKIIDFGIATRFNRTNPTFKSHHALEGTLLYLSPEQTGRMNRLLDYRTDFYSLGVTFYELLTGQLPFPTTDILELVHCHIAKQPPPPDELNATIPKAVSNIIMKLMAKNAEDRYQNAWGIKADLEICAEQLTEIGKIDNIQLGLLDIQDRFQIPQKLYGRDKEVAMLIATFERVAASPNHAENISEQEQNSNSAFPVEMMLVSGYAGIGKSALVQEIYKPITQKRGYFISGKFDQFQRDIPYSAIADALQKLVQQLLGESDEQVQQWRSRLLAALGNNGQIIIDVIPEVELIIGKQPPAPEVGTTEAQNRFNRIFQSFVRVFCSKEHPLVIFLDDLQWIDSATLKLIELMLLDEQIQSLFLIGAYRDNEVNSTHLLALMLERLRKQGVVFQKIILTPLTLEPLSQLIAETLHQNTDNVHSLAELVLRKTERNEIARLNLIAGQKAKAAIAHNVAKKYLVTAKVWLADSSWQTNYDLTLELYSETTEVAFLCGDFEQVEYWVAIVLQEAQTILDTVKVYEVKIQTYIAQSQLLAAIDIALQILQQLGITFPKISSQSDIRLELDPIASLIGSKPIEDLSHLPQMTEPDKLAAMRILSSITVAAYIVAPDLMPLLASKQVNLSIQYGNAFASPFAYALCGLILCGMVGKIESGYQFGQLALRQLSQPNTHSLRARTLMFVNIFIIHRKEHIRKILQPLLEAYQSGLETGDFEFAAYCAHTYCLQSFVVGKELLEVEREMRTFSEAIRQFKQEAVLNWAEIFQQSILNLRECPVNPTSLIGESNNEDNTLTQDEQDGFAIFLVYFNKLLVCYLFSKYDRAVENSARAENYLLQVRATPSVPLYYLYDSLARLAVYPGSNNQVQEEILKKVAVNQETIQDWARYAPMNYLHKYHLVQAEIARVSGQLLEAEEFYEQAIQGASENGYIQEEALAYELAAKHYLVRGREKFAQTYMKEAHYCYKRWGAVAKVKDLETRYQQLFPQPLAMAYTPIHTTSGTTSNNSDIAFDLAVVLKASQAISSEMELDQLLSSLMKILIENAGAQTGFLILENLGKWAIEASCELNDSKNVCATQVLQSIPPANRLPESIINYVIRTHESVILNDATCEGNFVNEPYIQHNQTQSIFCLPLLNQGKLVGVLYPGLARLKPY
ncbi:MULTISPECIES: AAA family ATPase [unclassified Nostoc]|uniref:AAA family ATPase n=1 Tax=unclassified Nostoc TaxID=2593658 RepID=UPI00260C9961|nr:AAA family ATPase [Nostoc sp. S13]MDF5740261.1 AAA family ATPase [Nostoc sp. S13]